MSAAAVISRRIKRIFNYLRQHNALSEETAVLQADVPYSDRWYYRRLIEYGAVVQVGDKCWLDEPRARAYRMARLKRGLIFIAAAAVLFILYLIVTQLK